MRVTQIDNAQRSAAFRGGAAKPARFRTLAS